MKSERGREAVIQAEVAGSSSESERVRRRKREAKERGSGRSPACKVRGAQCRESDALVPNCLRGWGRKACVMRGQMYVNARPKKCYRTKVMLPSHQLQKVERAGVSSSRFASSQWRESYPS